MAPAHLPGGRGKPICRGHPTNQPHETPHERQKKAEIGENLMRGPNNQNDNKRRQQCPPETKVGGRSQGGGGEVRGGQKA